MLGIFPEVKRVPRFAGPLLGRILSKWIVYPERDLDFALDTISYLLDD